MYKLLIADDEAVEREAVKFFIKNSNIEFDRICEASNGIETVEIAKKVKPDIAVLDIRMPGKSGLDAAREIQDSEIDCRFIFLTAFNEFDYAHQAIKVKAEDFIIKPAKGEDLIKVLHKVIEGLDRQQELKELETRASLFTTWFENDLMLSVAKGFIPENRIKDYFNKMDISFKDAVCAIIRIGQSVKVGRAKQSEKNLTSRAISIIKKLEVGSVSRHLFGAAKMSIYMMAMTNEGFASERKIEALFKQIRSTLLEKMDVDIQIGIGKMFRDPKEASNSFFQAKFANRSGSALNVSNFSIVEKQKENMKYPIKDEKNLCDCIIKGDEKAAEEHVEVLMDWISQFSGTVNWAREKTHELITIVDRAVIREFSIKTTFIQNRVKELNGLQSMNEIIIFFKNFITEIIIRINSVRNSPANHLVEKACSYIDHNLSKNIQLEEIAEMLGFSKYYFSKIFKRYRNMNFVDYVTLRRMEKAKELLSNLMLSVKEIAADIGYNDPNYFANVFKKHEGISATEYRIKHLGDGTTTKYQMWKHVH